MKRATWLRAVAALTYAFVLAQLSGCGIGSGAGQVAPPTPSPVSSAFPAAPAALTTSEPIMPEPVISVYPPANSATAIVYATAGAQRTATSISYSATEAAVVTAVAKAAPTYAAQQTVQAATEEAATHPTPQSARVERGKAYPFVLDIVCNDYYADFDGSFWDVLEKNFAPTSLSTPILNYPSQSGTMTLTDDDHAMFEFDNGSIFFARHVGPKVLPGSCG
ncbi:MAG TPA: hypothetical protein VGN15_01790 [Ktedonobacteraceae bacterium]|nr:hypothetical protein [Ktedonobacteraceae bacterium]